MKEPDEEDVKISIEMPIRIRPYDVDFMGIINNTVYPKYFEALSTSALESRMNLSEMLSQNEGPVVMETNIKYLVPITLSSKPIGKVTLTFKPPFRWFAEMIIRDKRDDKIIYCVGTRKGCYINLKTKRPAKIPEKLLCLNLD